MDQAQIVEARAYRADIMADGFVTLHSSPIPFRAGGVTRFTLIFLAAPDDIARAERDEALATIDGPDQPPEIFHALEETLREVHRRGMRIII